VKNLLSIIKNNVTDIITYGVKWSKVERYGVGSAFNDGVRNAQTSNLPIQTFT
jgi:hypothetical protein